MYIGELTYSILSNLIIQITNYLPRFLSGLIIVIIGLVIAGLVRGLILKIFTFKELKILLTKAKISTKTTVDIWARIISEIFKWSIILLFLVSAAEIWGIPRVSEVFSQLLLFTPNVIVAVFVGLVGVIMSNIVHDVVNQAVVGLGAKPRGLLSTGAKYAILFFTVLIIFSQLGVVPDLIRILFTSIVVMIAIAGGLAFGLGGQHIAREFLENLKNKISQE